MGFTSVIQLSGKLPTLVDKKHNDKSFNEILRLLKAKRTHSIQTYVHFTFS